MTRACGTCLWFSPKFKTHIECKKCEDKIRRSKWMPRSMKCGICESEMVYHNNEFLRCHDCGTEFWPFVSGDKNNQLTRQDMEKMLQCDRSTEVQDPLMHIGGKKMGGNKSKRKKPKNLMQKQSSKKIYDGLCTQKPEKAIGFVNPVAINVDK